MSYIIVDTETRSACDLRKCGAWVYAQHPTTEIICVGYTIDGNKPGVWMPGMPLPEDVLCAIRDGAWVVCHNVGFDQSIWRFVLEKYGWPDWQGIKWFDTLASCARKCLPLDLKKAARVLELPFQKGETPRKFFSPSKKSGEYARDDDNIVVSYNIQDIMTQNALFKAVGTLTPEEMEVWRLDQKINQRGVRLDLPYVRAAIEVVEKATGPLLEEFRAIAGVNPTQRDKFMLWLFEQGVVLPDLTKETVNEVLGEETDDGDYESLAGDSSGSNLGFLSLTENVRRSLEIRKEVNSASTKKLYKMLNCVGEDSRARYLLQYHGAGSGRWAGRLLQPQNFPRGEVKIDPNLLVGAIMSRDPEWVRMVAGVDPIKAVSSGLRHAIVPAPGSEFGVGDFATIEARIDLALAGQTDKVELLRTGGFFYEDMAEKIFGVLAAEIKKGAKSDPPDPIMSGYRQIGKNTALGCGFQMGAAKFMLKYAKDKSLDWCKEVINIYRKEWAPEVPKLWAGLERAALETVKTGRPHEAYGVLYKLEGRWMTARLPSGRKLFYFHPKLVHKEMPWSTEEKPDHRLAWTYWTRKGGKWVKMDAYGGLLTENVVQGLARDLMVAAMFKAEAEGLPVVLTVHDEIVVEKPGHVDPKMLEQIMTDVPSWAREIGVPVAAECWSGDRYKKA